MFKNYLKIAGRNIWKNKAYSFINIAGLAIGMACCMLILLYVLKEVGYDDHHRDADQIYRVAIWKDATGQKQGQASVSYLTAEVLLLEYPQVQQAARIFRFNNEDAAVQIDDRRFIEPRFFFADASLFDIFTIPFLRGDPATALSQPNSVVVTEEIARKYFNTLEVLGETVTVNLRGRNIDYKITGVVSNAPEASHFKYDLLAWFQHAETLAPDPDFFRSWFGYQIWTYIKLPKGYDPRELEAGLVQLVKKYFPSTRQSSRLFLQRLRDIHLSGNLENECEPNNDIQYIYIFSAIAVLVLIIACINFMNLSTARSLNRAREVGLRKVVGAQRVQLIKQFLVESLLVSFLAVTLALAMVEGLAAIFNKLSIIQLRVSYFENSLLLLGLLALTVAVGVISGLYPAIFLSAFQPVRTLKKSFAKSGLGANMRKTLVVAQMAITVILLVAIVTIAQQLEYIRKKKLGFEKEQMLLIKATGTALTDKQNYETFKSQLLQLPEVMSVTKNAWVTGEGFPIRSIYFNAINDEEKIALPFNFVGHDYTKTYGLELAAGRDFSKEFATDTSFAYLVNEAAVRQYGIEPVLGRVIASGDRNPVRGPIVGVVKDFHFAPLHESIEPMVIGLFDLGLPLISVRLNTATLSNSLAQIESVWRQFEKIRPMDFFFLDNRLDSVYKFETQLGKIVAYFTTLAILIACLGLFGMALFAAEQRTKEIGIRKVLGASVPNIFMSFSFDFIKLMMVANLVAWPIAFVIMRRWLNDFAYRIDISAAAFLFAGAIAIGIAILTVSYQAIKSAIANPVEALRYE